MDNKFQILNATIEFSDEFINYNKLRARFLDMSNDALDEFTLSYGENFKTLEDVYTKGIELGEECLDKYVGKAISVLIEYDVLNIDKNLFLKKYIKEGFSWQEDFQEILAKDKENNNGDKKKKKEENTEDNFIKRELGKSIKKNVFNIHYAVVEALKNSGITSIGEAVSQEDKEEAEALFNNLSLGLIPQEKETKVIESIIYKNPYDDRVYLYILKKYGDETKGVEDITRFLKVSVIDEKEKLIKAYYENLDKSTEESTLESIEKFKAYANKMHYNETLVYFNEFDKILAEHDLKLRTVDGEVFNTREEANIAKEELKKVLEIEEEIKEDTEEDLTIAIDKIQEMEFETDIYIKHLESLKAKRSQIIRAEEENYLNENYSLLRITTEGRADVALEELEKLNIRNVELVETKILQIKAKRDEIIREADSKELESFCENLVMINREGINKAIEAIRELDIRTTSLKDEKIKLIESKADKIMKKHSALLEKAKKYEQRKNEIPLTPKEEKSGFMGLITKAIDKGSSLIDEYQEKSEKEAWEFITANGMRSIKDVEDNQ